MFRLVPVCQVDIAQRSAVNGVEHAACVVPGAHRHRSLCRTHIVDGVVGEIGRKGTLALSRLGKRSVRDTCRIGKQDHGLPHGVRIQWRRIRGKRQIGRVNCRIRTEGIATSRTARTPGHFTQRDRRRILGLGIISQLLTIIRSLYTLARITGERNTLFRIRKITGSVLQRTCDITVLEEIRSSTRQDIRRLYRFREICCRNRSIGEA